MNKKNNIKKVTKKEIFHKLLENELKKDPRFARMSFDKAIMAIEELRKENNSHLSDRAYSLFIGYKYGLSVYKKYAKNFRIVLKNRAEEFIAESQRLIAKAQHYHNLECMFNNVIEEVSSLMK